MRSTRRFQTSRDSSRSALDGRHVASWACITIIAAMDRDNKKAPERLPDFHVRNLLEKRLTFCEAEFQQPFSKWSKWSFARSGEKPEHFLESRQLVVPGSRMAGRVAHRKRLQCSPGPQAAAGFQAQYAVLRQRSFHVSAQAAQPNRTRRCRDRWLASRRMHHLQMKRRNK
jgi:hypothetical protein